MDQKPKILLVDDLRENLLVLQALLDREEVELLEARSGNEALELLLAHDVALAIVDVQMPELDGFELAEFMRGTERTRHVPIIFVTAGPQDRQGVFKGYESGAVDFLYKPLDPHVLRSKVAVFIELHTQRARLTEQLATIKAAEEALRQADRHKDEFLALLSHELRNPLMPLRNSLFILQRAEAGGEQSERARLVMTRQVDQLARLVDDLLDVTRISRGKVQLRIDRTDLQEIARRTIEDHQPGFAAAGVHLEARLGAEPLWLEGDDARLAQVLGNLLGNALKFTSQGGRVRVSLRRQAQEAVLTVEDDGIGIHPEVLPRIFEPFAQAERQLDRSPGGLGLGLVLVRGMAELHGGTVLAHSPGLGQGAVFTLRLPVEPPSAAQARATVDQPPGDTQSRRVLVVEDSPDSAESMREALEFMGHEVAVAFDGPMALEVAHTFGPQVVLCDIGLPGMDGYEVARRFRAEPSLRDAVLVAVTGYAAPEDRRRASEAGFTHHTAKPPSLDALERLLSEV